MMELLILGVVIGSNNFAVSLALGSLGQKVRRWRIVFTFGSFEFAIPLLGMWLGQQASSAIADAAGWLGPTLLALLGIWTVAVAWRSQETAEELASRTTTWGGLLMLSAGLSLDNLLVGFSLGLREADPLAIAATIAVFSMTFAWLGLQLGNRARETHRKWAEAGTGLLLIALAAAMATGAI
ncbi:MAG: manganese efflux pump MntP family protein [Erythrobacter sp.]